MGVNVAIQHGRIAHAGFLTYANSGVAILKFSLAVNTRKKVSGEWQDQAHFFDYVLFGKRAEALEQHLTQGRAVTVQSAPQQETWKDSSGGKKHKVSFIVDDVELGSLPKEKSPTPAETAADVFAEFKPPAGNEGFDDDVPF